MPKLMIGALIEKDGKILLVKDGDKYNLPTSNLDKGINIIADLKRDVQVMVGLEIEPEAVVGIFEQEKLIRIYFKTKIVSGEAKGSWFTLDEIYKLVEEEKAVALSSVLDNYRLEKFVPLDFIEKFKGL